MKKVIIFITTSFILLLLGIYHCRIAIQNNIDGISTTTIKATDHFLDSIKNRINLSHKAVVVLRINENDCNACIDFELENLKKLPVFLQNRVVLLCRFKNSRALNVIISKYDIKVPIIIYLENIPGIYLENIGKPYYFTIDKDKNLSNFHISKIEESKSTFHYFQKIKEHIIDSDISYVNDNIFFNTTHYDLGNIKINTDHMINFYLENLSYESLIIENVTATCGCTSVIWERKSIRPGTKTKLSVNFHSYSKGFFYKKVIVSFSNGHGTRILTIKGNVI